VIAVKRYVNLFVDNAGMHVHITGMFVRFQ